LQFGEDLEFLAERPLIPGGVSDAEDKVTVVRFAVWRATWAIVSRENHKKLSFDLAIMVALRYTNYSENDWRLRFTVPFCTSKTKKITNLCMF
jgi:hypothetical protein